MDLLAGPCQAGLGLIRVWSLNGQPGGEMDNSHNKAIWFSTMDLSVSTLTCAESWSITSDPENYELGMVIVKYKSKSQSACPIQTPQPSPLTLSCSSCLPMLLWSSVCQSHHMLFRGHLEVGLQLGWSSRDGRGSSWSYLCAQSDSETFDVSDMTWIFIQIFD